MNIGIFYILIANLIACTTGLCIRNITDLSGLLIVFITSLIGVGLIFLAYLFTGQLGVLKTIKFNVRFLIYPILQSAVTIFVYLAFSDPNFITTGIELIINATPLPIIFIAPLILKESSTRREIIATIMGFSGLLIFIAFQESSGSILSFGLLFAFLGLIFDALAITFQRKVATAIDVRVLPFLVSITNILFTGIAILITEPSSFTNIEINMTSWVFIFLLAFMNIIVVFLVSHGLKTVKSQVMSSLLLIKPVVVAILGWFLLDESISLMMAIGGLIATSSVALTLTETKERSEEMDVILEELPEQIILTLEKKIDLTLRIIRGEKTDQLSIETGVDHEILSKLHDIGIDGMKVALENVEEKIPQKEST
jgi:drug/metabolite transporter (DMT)-like permease